MNAIDRAKDAEIRPDWIPARDYTDRRVWEAERERLWPRIWQIVCRETDLEGIGDFVNYEILDDSILVVRVGKGRDDVVAFYNVCQHRGRKLVEEPSGNLGGRILCRYHGWQFSIHGELTHVPFAEDWKGCPNFDTAALRLPKVRVERWGGWIWLNQDENAEPLLDWLAPIPERVDPFEPEAMHARWWKTIHAPVNWKAVLEAFNESYHAIPTHNSAIVYTVHAPARAYGRHSMFYFEPSDAPVRYRNREGKWVIAKTAAEGIWAAHKHLDNTLFAMTLEPTVAAATRLQAETAADATPEALFARLWELQKDEFARRRLKWPKNLTMEAVERAGVSWHIFPNSIVLPTVDGALWYRFRPHNTDPDQCIVDVWCFGRIPEGDEPTKVKNEVFDGFEPFRGHNPFLEEDFPNIGAANKGMKIRGWKGAKLNPVQETAVYNFHRNLAEFRAKPK